MLKISQRLKSAPALIVAGVALLGIGGAIGATASSSMEPQAVMASAAPTSIKSLADAARPWAGEPVVTVRGRVTQLFGRQFILNDGTGQVLVAVGGHGVGEGGIALNQVLTVQGSYDDGTIRPSFLIGPDGRVAALGRGGHHGAEERGHRGGHDADADGPPRGPDQAGNQSQPDASGEAGSPATQPTK